MRTRLLVLVVTLATAISVAPASAANAAPAQPTCGSTLTVSARLRADLTCTGDGLRLGPGVTLDLGGHVLAGPGTGTGIGVAWSGPVEVRNGRLTGWGVGIDTWEDADPDAEGVSGGPLTVTRVTVEHGGTGVDASGEDGTGRFRKVTSVVRSTFRLLDSAIGAGWFADVAVDRSTFTDNRLGIWSGGSLSVSGSTFARHTNAVRGTEASVTIVDSTFLDNETAAGPWSSATATIDSSRFTGNAVGVASGSFGTVVQGSRFTSNGVGIEVLGFVHVEGNTLRVNGVGIQTRPQGDSLEGQILGNTLRQNGDGIVLRYADTWIEVGGNDVRQSTGWGIYAPGVTDLGGNVATRNGTEPQCVGVVCTGRPPGPSS